ncbi:MAG: hypothetical protein ACK56F_29855, partial [bacterium]
LQNKLIIMDPFRRYRQTRTNPQTDSGDDSASSQSRKDQRDNRAASHSRSNASRRFSKDQ